MTIQQGLGGEELTLLVDTFLSSLTNVDICQEASKESNITATRSYNNAEKEKKEVKAVSIVPGVIRHTSQPNTSLAYYYNYK